MGTGRSTAVIFAMVAALAFPLAVEAQSKPAPSEIDLKVAYCLGALDTTLKDIEPKEAEYERAAAEPNAPPIAKAFVEMTRTIRSNRERVRAYVAARSLQVDLVLIALALKQGENDTIQYSNNTLAGPARQEVSKRTEACIDLSWMPF